MPMGIPQYQVAYNEGQISPGVGGQIKVTALQLKIYLKKKNIKRLDFLSVIIIIPENMTFDAHCDQSGLLL